MGHERFIARCPYCDWATTPLSVKRDAKHARFEHIFSEHKQEKSINWHNEVPDLEVLEP